MDISKQKNTSVNNLYSPHVALILKRACDLDAHGLDSCTTINHVIDVTISVIPFTYGFTHGFDV